MASSKKMQVSIISILVAFLCISKTFVSGGYTKFEKLELPAGVKGAGGLAFRTLTGWGPYVTTLDGRIMDWNGTFKEFSYISELNRDKEECDGVDNPDMWSTCGRPLALSYADHGDMLYIADAYFGLAWVAADTRGEATSVDIAINFANDVEVNLISGHVYVNDASLTYNIRDAIKPGFIPDATGRILRYDPILTEKVTVLMTGLRGGGGITSNKDGTFLLISEIGGYSIKKYWLEGPKANTSEVLLQVNGNPNKITRAEKAGEFWVATTRIGYVPSKPIIIPEGVRFNSDGQVLEIVQFGNEYPNLPISLVLENKGKLYVASHYTNFIGLYSN